MAIEWNETYSVGVELFDEHHKQLFVLLHKLELCNENSQENDDLINKTLKELMEYTHYHFSEEEKALERYNYNDLERQKKGHAYFVSQIEDYHSKYLGGSKPQLTDVVNFLNEWLLQHILDSDFRYTQLLKDKIIN